jgi:hypothetical protein
MSDVGSERDPDDRRWFRSPIGGMLELPLPMGNVLFPVSAWCRGEVEVWCGVHPELPAQAEDQIAVEGGVSANPWDKQNRPLSHTRSSVLVCASVRR